MEASIPPRWDLQSFFEVFDSAEQKKFETKLASELKELLADTEKLAPLNFENAAAWSDVVLRVENLLARVGKLSAYFSCLSSADANDERFQLAEARIIGYRSVFEKVSNELRRAWAGASDEVFRDFMTRRELKDAAFFFEQMRKDARHRMSNPLEGLAADLGPDGLYGWGRLYDVVSAKLTFELTLPSGEQRHVPMAQRRSLMADVDRTLRKSAFVEGNRAWENVGDVAAAALNHIAGTRHTLNVRRGISDVLDVALHEAAISRKTLDAMMEAVRGGAPVAQRGLRLKAKALGVPALSWFDLEAPLPVASSSRIPWDRGVALIGASFRSSYPKLAKFFEDALAKNWVEAEPRDGKRPGAYCTTDDVSGESRVFMTYQGSLGDVSTLAHEIGHAFHSFVLCPKRVLARQYPMTLAETASTFAESLLVEGLLRSPETSVAQRAALLAEVVGDAASFLLDVPSRFVFEKKFYAERRSGEVPPTRLCELVIEAQREVFGSALAVGGEDPWFWASKLHFFIPDATFYNFPYTFGYLLSRGLYALLRKEGEAFLPRYEAFLEQTGSGMAHEVAQATVGRNLEEPEFWSDAIRTLEAPIAELERILPEVLPA